MSVPIPLRVDFDASRVRGLAKKAKDGPQARRLLAVAAIYDGATRSEAAKIGGVGLQIIRDWVMRFTGPTACKVTQVAARHNSPGRRIRIYRQWPSTLCIAATRMIARYAFSPSSPAPCGRAAARRWGLTARRDRSNRATVPPMHDYDARECITQ
jgi:hypothetical protein